MLLLSLTLALGGEPAQAPAPDQTEATTPSDQRIVCRSRPRLGSRIVSQRSCRTIWEWRVYERDLEQSRRDINDRGARGQEGPGT